jgi:lysophospholipase L1-like esterase
MSRKQFFPQVFAAVLVSLLAIGLANCATAGLSKGWIRSDETPQILIYGDSITWGSIPREDASPPGRTRYFFSERWPGVIQYELGTDYFIIEEGLGGRTAGIDEYSVLDPLIKGDVNLNGRPYFLPAIRSHEPLALVVIMLGTNDTRGYHKQTIQDIQASITHLIQIVKLGSRQEKKPKILLVAPPPGRIGGNSRLNKSFEGSYELAAQLGLALKEVAQKEQVEFFDSATIVPYIEGIDGIHLTVEENKKLGIALADKIRQILE